MAEFGKILSGIDSTWLLGPGVVPSILYTPILVGVLASRLYTVTLATGLLPVDSTQLHCPLVISRILYTVILAWVVTSRLYAIKIPFCFYR